MPAATRFDRTFPGPDPTEVAALWGQLERALLRLALMEELSPRAVERVSLILGDHRPAWLDDGTLP